MERKYNIKLKGEKVVNKELYQRLKAKSPKSKRHEQRIHRYVDCVASVSARVRREKLGREQKKKGMTREGEGKEENACPQTPRFWRPRTQLLIGAVLVVLIA